MPIALSRADCFLVRIELYTEPYAAAYGSQNAEIVFERYAVAAKKAQVAGLGVNAGHDLNLKNLGQFCSIPNILEVSIGHALIADALWMGLFNAVQAYLKLLSECLPGSGAAGDEGEPNGGFAMSMTWPQSGLRSVRNAAQDFFAAAPPDVRKWLCPSGRSGIVYLGLRPDFLAR